MAVSYKELGFIKGYNKLDLSFSGDDLTVLGTSEILGVLKNFNSTIQITGAAGWRYTVSDIRGVISIETIPGGEITANTQVYSPTPTFNTSRLGYYSSVNTNKRIIAIVYFNGTNILEVIPYGNGKNKNDNLWISPTDSISKTTANSRLQLTAAFDKSRGTDITCVDNGSGTSDSEGFRVTANSPQKININGNLLLTATNSGSTVYIACNKNGSLFKNLDRLEVNGTSTEVSHIVAFNVNDIASIGDYYTFYIVLLTSGIAQLRNVTVTCEVL